MPRIILNLNFRLCRSDEIITNEYFYYTLELLQHLVPGVLHPPMQSLRQGKILDSYVTYKHKIYYYYYYYLSVKQDAPARSYTSYFQGRFSE